MAGKGRVDNQLSFRWAQVEDFDVVFSLASQLAAHIEASIPPLTVEGFQTCYIGSRSPMRLLLALSKGRVLGMISWTLTHELYSADTRVYISDLSVDSAARGRGVGTALMAQVKAWARAHGAGKLGWEIWHQNHTAKAFYEGMGATIDEEAVPYVLTLEDEESQKTHP
jgi:GNAT superfamily N-acetyltransferase